MDFGLMFFSSAAQTESHDPYYLLKEVARYADQHGFVCIWTPERHFHEFGGAFPNPSVLSAALAMITQKIQIRAGSVISPLHNPIRIAEEWSIVDNLSSGRVAISFGSGWNIDDFVFYPDRYQDRHAIMHDQIKMIREFWRGKATRQINPAGKELSLRLFPTPVQPELPLWITSSGNIDTFISAGALGANVLTHLLGQDVIGLAQKIEAYREARGQHGHDPAGGIVSLMLHTFLGDDIQRVKSEARLPLREYLRSAVSLERESAQGGGVISGSRHVAVEEITAKDMEDLLDLAFERYANTSALIGTPESCMDMIARCGAIGVNEIACLIDFGLSTERVLEGLTYLDVLRTEVSSHGSAELMEKSIKEFISGF